MTLFDSFRGIDQFSNISKDVSNYLSTVYFQLATTIIFWVGGFSSYPYIHQSIPTNKLIQLFIVSSLMIPIIIYRYQERYWKNILLYIFGFCKGLFIGDLISITNIIDPNIVKISLSVAIVVFSTMSLIALQVKNRFSLYFGSVLFSCLNCLVLFHLIQWVFNIFPVEFVLNIDIYLGIILFSLYICYDTQKIIYDASRNYKDSVFHTLELFLDFVNVFIRILLHLIRKKKNKDE